MEKRFGYVLFLWVFMVFSCVDGTEFDTPRQDCNVVLQPNISFADLNELIQEKVFQIQEDLVLEAYVVSSDSDGNFFGELYLQDTAQEPSQGIVFEIDLRESHLLYPAGSKVFIKLKGLYLGKSGETLKLGGTFTSFGNISVGRLPALKVPEHIVLACGAQNDVLPISTSILQIETIPLNTLVKIENLEFLETDLGQSFAIAEEETIRTLKDCEENEITMANSGYSDFQAEPLPINNGSVTGILIQDGKQYQLRIRDVKDLEFTNERCPEIITEFTSTQLFISELADPNNNAGARFVELYNSAQEPLDLNLWTLRRYTNANVEVSSVIDLSGLVIPGEGTLVISPNATEFEIVYGFPPDLGVSTNSPADSNGDDNLELVDPFGTVIDSFGVVGEDGSGTNHEFEDGRAVRKPTVNEGNPNFTFDEWDIYNDTGAAETVNLPQNAPQDFTPGIFEKQ